MSKIFLIPDVDLNLFDGEGSGGAAAGAAAAEARAATGAAEPQRVVYGKQQSPSEGQPAGTDTKGRKPEDNGQQPEQAKKPEKSDRERRAAFRALMDGEYRDLYGEEMQRAISRRMRGVDQVREQNTKMQGVLDLVGELFGVDATDTDRLRAAIDDSRELWAEAAEKAGMSVDTYRRVRALERENAAMKAMREQEAEQRQQAEAAQAAERRYQGWLAEAEELRAEYPDFDLAAEGRDEDFRALLRAGVSVRQAYEVRNLDRIRTQAAQDAARTTEKAVTETIKARGKRPAEAGTGAQSGGITVKDDVSKLTDDEIMDVLRRVKAGERISFG